MYVRRDRDAPTIVTIRGKTSWKRVLESLSSLLFYTPISYSSSFSTVYSHALLSFPFSLAFPLPLPPTESPTLTQCNPKNDATFYTPTVTHILVHISNAFPFQATQQKFQGFPQKINRTRLVECPAPIAKSAESHLVRNRNMPHVQQDNLHEHSLSLNSYRSGGQG